MTVFPSQKEATITAVKSTHLEVDLATNEGIIVVSWYNVCKAFSNGDFVCVTSSPLRGTMGWVELIADDIASLLGYDEKGNLTSSRDDTIEVSFILYQLRSILIYGIILQRYEIHVNWLKLMTVPFLHTSSTLMSI